MLIFKLSGRLQKLNQFNNDGSVLERKHRKLSSVRSSENVDAVSGAAKKPQQINMEGCAQLGISRRWVQQILKSDLNLHPYK
jgi:hypothetical protein